MSQKNDLGLNSGLRSDKMWLWWMNEMGAPQTQQILFHSLNILPTNIALNKIERAFTEIILNKLISMFWDCKREK